MPTIALKLTPLDVLFFRDSRPFGQADTAYSGLPTPQTFHGLVKTYVARRSQLPFHQIHGLRQTQNPKRWISDIETRGVWLYRDGQVFVRIPSNIVQLGKQGGSYRLLRPLNPEIEMPGWEKGEIRPLAYRELAGDESIRAASGFLNQQTLHKYLQDFGGEQRWTSDDVTRDDELYSFEPRIGIGIDSKSMTAMDGQIYSASFMRLRAGVSFYGEVTLEDEDAFGELERLFSQPSVLPWGGEGRQVQVERCDPVAWPAAPELQAGSCVFSLLITPGIFGSRDPRGKNGNGENALPSWRPAGFGTLRGAMVGKPMPISGWSLSGLTYDDADESSPNSGAAVKSSKYDPEVFSHIIQNGRPKPTRYAAAPGSVYFWQLGANNRSVRNGRLLQPIEPLCNKPIESAIGWGMSLTGSWSWECLDRP